MLIKLTFVFESLTRPKIMHRLANLGFTQSYSYFAWRNGKRETVEYLTDLAAGEGCEYFRPNRWPNTPDIPPEGLQDGGRPSFMAWLVLPATLLNGAGYRWQEPLSFVELDPRVLPCQIFCLRRRIRTEQDFETYF